MPVNHVGRHGSCFAETGWSEQKVRNTREAGSGDAALLRGLYTSLVASLVKPTHPGVVVTELPADPSQVQQAEGRCCQVLLTGLKDAPHKPVSQLAVTLAAASILRVEHKFPALISLTFNFVC